MKKLFFFFTFLVAACSGTAQTPVPETIPQFKILTTDSVNITLADLKKDKPVMIIYFQPDCGHCQHMMNQMRPEMDKFKNVQVILVTFVQLKAIRVFYKDYGLQKYPNFIVGTEGYSHPLLNIYNLKTTPYIALYDHKGKLYRTFEKAPSMNELEKAVNKL